MPKPELAALVTGGGRGIGREISKALARKLKLPVFLIGRNAEALRRTAKEISSSGGTAAWLSIDLGILPTGRKPTFAERIKAKLKKLNWSISDLVLNAGIGKSGSSEEVSDEDFLKTFQVNALSMMPLIRMVLPAMKERGQGTVCSINSIAGLKGVSHDAAYSGSKHAQIGIFRSLALEYGKFGISFVPICPGFVEGEMTERSIAALATRKRIDSSEARAIIARTNPQRRIIPPQEVAAVVAFVCSGVAPSLSGSPLILTGGAT